MPLKTKPTIAITSLTCCEGCQVAILDLGARFLEVAKHVKIGDFAFLEDTPDIPTYDVVFVEGAPITEENIARLKKLRAKSKILVALGACAALGGIILFAVLLNTVVALFYLAGSRQYALELLVLMPAYLYFLFLVRSEAILQMFLRRRIGWGTR